jgi:CheY-like chemotaxis protein
MPLRAKESVLIASSDEQETTAWVRYLAAEASPFLTATAHTVPTVFEYLEQAPKLPALIILDIQLAMAEDFTLLKQLKNTPAYQVIPVIVLATLNDTQNIHQCYALQANACLVKPASDGELKTLIEKTKKFWLVMSANPVAGPRHN